MSGNLAPQICISSSLEFTTERAFYLVLAQQADDLHAAGSRLIIYNRENTRGS